jgi:uncharacterized membrane protein
VTEYNRLYLRTLLLALACSAGLVGIGWVGDVLDVGPGLVPIWDPEGRGYWLVSLTFVVICGFLYHTFDRELDRSDSTGALVNGQIDSVGDFPTRWILPTVSVLGVVLFLGVYRGFTAVSTGALVAFVALLAGPISRHLMHDRREQILERARLVHTLVVHGIAFLALSMIYINKVRSLFSATAVMVVGILLLLALSEGEDRLFSRRLVYAIIGGIMLGQITWALNYWRATGLTGGAILLIFFYLAGGLILTHLRRGVLPRDVLEYGSVTALAFSIIVYAATR